MRLVIMTKFYLSNKITMRKAIKKKFNAVETVRENENYFCKAEIRQIWNWKWQTYFGLTITDWYKTKLHNAYYTFRCEAEAFARWFMDWYDKGRDI